MNRNYLIFPFSLKIVNNDLTSIKGQQALNISQILIKDVWQNFFIIVFDSNFVLHFSSTKEAVKSRQKDCDICSIKDTKNI